MPQAPRIVFICEHGGAKSIIAATYFNKLAVQIGSDLRAIARGTNPDHKLSPQTVQGLLEDGLTPTEPFPRQLTQEDIQFAKRLITFCELPMDFQQTIVEHWDNVPPVSESYGKARDAILEHIQSLLSQ